MLPPILFRSPSFAFFLLLMLVVRAGSQPATNRIFAVRAEKEFVRAQKLFAGQPTNAVAGWQLGRASFDWAEFATNDSQRAAVAQVGIAACRQALARAPKSAPAHYYLAMDYGQLAQAEAPSLAAYKLVREIEREFKTAADLDETFDFAGPPRCLGLLYRDAPSWPLSIGSRRKAREWLDRAAALAPAYPENPLNLAESQLRWHELADAEKSLKKLAAVWPAARTNLVGEAWESDWTDWTARRAIVRAELQKAGKHDSGL